MQNLLNAINDDLHEHLPGLATKLIQRCDNSSVLQITENLPLIAFERYILVYYDNGELKMLFAYCREEGQTTQFRHEVIYFDLTDPDSLQQLRTLIRSKLCSTPTSN